MENNLEIFLEELYKWNNKINLTGIKNKKVFYNKILLENITLAEKLNLNGEKILIDIGSGNGNLSIVLALSFPENKIIAVEKNLKKSVFIKRIKRKLNLKNLNVEIKKLEEINFFPGKSDNFIFFFRGMEFPSMDIRRLINKFNQSTFLFLLGKNSEGYNFLHKLSIPSNFKKIEMEINDKREIITIGEKINIFKS